MRRSSVRRMPVVISGWRRRISSSTAIARMPGADLRIGTISSSRWLALQCFIRGLFVRPKPSARRVTHPGPAIKKQSYIRFATSFPGAVRRPPLAAVRTDHLATFPDAGPREEGPQEPLRSQNARLGLATSVWGRASRRLCGPASAYPAYVTTWIQRARGAGAVSACGPFLPHLETLPDAGPGAGKLAPRRRCVRVANLQQPVDLNQDGFRGPGEALWH
jgi:hypothetical protein